MPNAMSGSDDDSRSAAVGRKRARAGDLNRPRADKQQRLADQEFFGRESHSSSRRSSTESGEISSSSKDGFLQASSSASTQTQPREHPLDTGRDLRSALDGQAADISSEDDGGFSSSSQDSASNSSDGSQAGDAANSHATRLSHLPPGERELQRRYFNISEPRALARCLCCGQQGHARQACPSRTCEHCGARDQHASPGCPRHRKCSRCRLRGHDARACRYHGAKAAALGDACDLCGETDHVEEECGQLASAIVPDERARQRIPAAQMYVSCYACGASGRGAHWGDDCPRLSRSERCRPKSAWSAQQAGKYIVHSSLLRHSRSSSEDSVPRADVHNAWYEDPLAKSWKSDADTYVQC